MRHPHANFFHPGGWTFVKNRIENHHERLRALERKALLSDVARVEKSLEELRFQELAEERNLHVARRAVLRRP